MYERQKKDVDMSGFQVFFAIISSVSILIGGYRIIEHIDTLTDSEFIFWMILIITTFFIAYPPKKED